MIFLASVLLVSNLESLSFSDRAQIRSRSLMSRGKVGTSSRMLAGRLLELRSAVAGGGGGEARSDISTVFASGIRFFGTNRGSTTSLFLVKL
jgi:hypothetical protein